MKAFFCGVTMVLESLWLLAMGGSLNHSCRSEVLFD